MPELPEVETVCRDLRKLIVGKEVRQVKVYLPKIIQDMSVKEFRDKLKGKKITDVNRRGKFILLGFDSGETLIVHLRMTGRLGKVITSCWT